MAEDRRSFRCGLRSTLEFRTYLPGAGIRDARAVALGLLRAALARAGLDDPEAGDERQTPRQGGRG
jgi:hypothetical protein